MDEKLEKFINQDDCYFIHYAAGGFYNGSSPAPKIACIVVYNLKNDVWHRFSVSDYSEGNSTDTAERLTFEKFKSFLEKTPDIKFIHWNMNAEGFGFRAIQARAKEFNIKLPVQLEDNLFDLSSYVSFIAEKRLSIKQILWFNSLLVRNDYLDGYKEAEYLRKWKYDEILKSVELKVKGLCKVVQLIKQDKLKTEAPYKKEDGLTYEERRAEALKLAQAREKMIDDIYKYNERFLNRKEQKCIREEEFFFFDFAHPFISMIANWVGKG